MAYLFSFFVVVYLSRFALATGDEYGNEYALQYRQNIDDDIFDYLDYYNDNSYNDDYYNYLWYKTYQQLLNWFHSKFGDYKEGDYYDYMEEGGHTPTAIKSKKKTARHPHEYVPKVRPLHESKTKKETARKSKKRRSKKKHTKKVRKPKLETAPHPEAPHPEAKHPEAKHPETAETSDPDGSVWLHDIKEMVKKEVAITTYVFKLKDETRKTIAVKKTDPKPQRVMTDFLSDDVYYPYYKRFCNALIPKSGDLAVNPIHYAGEMILDPDAPDPNPEWADFYYFRSWIHADKYNSKYLSYNYPTFVEEWTVFNVQQIAGIMFLDRIIFNSDRIDKYRYMPTTEGVDPDQMLWNEGNIMISTVHLRDQDLYFMLPIDNSLMSAQAMKFDIERWINALQTDLGSMKSLTEWFEGSLRSQWNQHSLNEEGLKESVRRDNKKFGGKWTLIQTGIIPEAFTTVHIEQIANIMANTIRMFGGILCENMLNAFDISISKTDRIYSFNLFRTPYFKNKFMDHLRRIVKICVDGLSELPQATPEEIGQSQIQATMRLKHYLDHIASKPIKSKPIKSKPVKSHHWGEHDALEKAKGIK